MRSPKFEFRAAIKSDIDAIFDLYEEIQSVHVDGEPEFCREAKRDEYFDRFFDGIFKDPEQHIVLACVNTTIVGFCQYFIGFQAESLVRRKKRIAYVNGLVVSKKFRRQGCGIALLEFVKSEAKKLGIASIGLDVWSFNTAAKACFSRAGFEVKQEQMWLSM